MIARKSLSECLLRDRPYSSSFNFNSSVNQISTANTHLLNSNPKEFSMIEKFFIYSHIFSGGLVLLLGLINFILKKGTPTHFIIGKIYVFGMVWICISALAVISFYRFSAFLMVIAVITFYSSFSGYRVLKRKEVGSEKWYDWAASILTSLFGIGLIIYGINLVASNQAPVLGILSMVFGLLSFNLGFRDLRFYWKKNDQKDKMWWLYQHISAISGSYIAAVTAFAVQNGDNFGIVNHNWLLWVLPGVIGTPFISLTIRKYKKASKSSQPI